MGHVLNTNTPNGASKVWLDQISTVGRACAGLLGLVFEVNYHDRFS